MPYRPRHLPAITIACLLAAGCGSSGSDTDGAATTQVDDPAAAVADPDADAAVVPIRQARAVERRLNALAVAFAPVTARINYLVAAETLRADAVASGADEATELERTGVVRVELRRMRDVLEQARPKVAAAAVSSSVEQYVRGRLLEAIDARLRAVSLHESALDGLAGDVGDTMVDARFAAWRSAWGESLRATREATTAMQDELVRVGRPPAPEESFR